MALSWVSVVDKLNWSCDCTENVLLKLSNKFNQWRRGTHVFGGAKGSTFPTNRKIFPTNQKFFRTTTFKFPPPPPPSTTLTISDNIDNFSTGLNHRGHGPHAPPPGHGATEFNAIDLYYLFCMLLRRILIVAVQSYQRLQLQVKSNQLTSN
jgi:hypothetical protein